MQDVIVLSDFQRKWLHKHFLYADSITNIGVDSQSGILYVESICQGCIHTVKVGVSDIIPQQVTL